MKKATPTIACILVASLSGFFAPGVIAVGPAPTPQCVPFTGTSFPFDNGLLVYAISGQEIVRHQFMGVAEGDKIAVHTSLPDRAYSQQIHRTSRQVVWTSEPISRGSIPGVIPQSDTTDLWISPDTAVGSHINIDGVNLLVGQADANNIYVGNNSDVTTLDARMYDKTTGVLKGINSPTSAPRLSEIQVCTITSPPPPPPPTAANFSVVAKNVPTHFTVNTETPITISVTNNGADQSGLIIDFEIDDQAHNLIFQQFVDNSAIPAGATRDFIFKWTPRNNGQFIGRLGIFTANWNSLILWNDTFIPSLHVGTVPTAQGDVVLTSGFITSTPYYLSQRAVLHALFNSPNPPSKNVSLDLELFNASGNRIAQNWFDGVSIPDANTVEKILDVPQYLPAGDYVFKVGVFNPGWGGLLHWYDNVAAFKLASLGQYEDQDVRMGFASTQPSTITEGQVSTLVASFFSPNTQNRVVLNFKLLDAQGVQIAEEFKDAAFPRTGTGNFEGIYTMNTPNTLKPGTYTFTVIILSADKTKVINTYAAAATLIVQAQ